MLDSFLPQHTPDLAHRLFGSIVGLLEFVLFLIESFEVVVFCDERLRGAVKLASEVQNYFFQGFQSGTNIFSLPFLSSLVLRAFLFLFSLLSFFDSLPFSPTCPG